MGSTTPLALGAQSIGGFFKTVVPVLDEHFTASVATLHLGGFFLRFGCRHGKAHSLDKRKSPTGANGRASSVSPNPKRYFPPAPVETYDDNDYTAGVAGVQGVLEKKFAPKREWSECLAEVYDYLADFEPTFFPGVLDGRAARTRDCGTFLEFRGERIDADFKLYHANFCRDRLCPMCNWRRSLKIFHQVSQVMDKLEPAGYRYIMLTLTIRNCEPDDLGAAVSAMQQGWRRLFHDSPAFRRTRSSFVIQGGVRVLEITRNCEDGSEWYGTYHPHYHLILAVKPDYFTGPGYIDHAGWVSLWRSACGLDYDPVVDVRVISPQQDSAGHLSMGAAVAEVAKYAVKDSDYLAHGSMWDKKEIVMQLLAGLTGRRLVSFFGCFFKARQELGLEDGDLVNVDGAELRNDVFQIIVRCQWRAGFYAVTTTTTDEEEVDQMRIEELEGRALDLKNEYFKW